MKNRADFGGGLPTAKFIYLSNSCYINALVRMGYFIGYTLSPARAGWFFVVIVVSFEWVIIHNVQSSKGTKQYSMKRFPPTSLFQPPKFPFLSTTNVFSFSRCHNTHIYICLATW